MNEQIGLAPKISVFLPTYNHSLYIAEAIESILMQDYPNIEIVVGDDCSLDNTREIVLSYADSYPDLFKLIFHKENIGVTANCNSVLGQCSGEFIALFSGDDVWLPNKLNKQVEWFKSNSNGVLCFTATEVIDESGKFIHYANMPSEDLIHNNIIHATHLLGECGPSFLIRKSALPSRGFPKEIPVFSDWYLWLAVAFKGKIGLVNDTLTKYRKHSNSTSTKNREIMLLEHIKCLTLLKYDFKNHSTILEGEINEKLWELVKLIKEKDLNNKLWEFVEQRKSGLLARVDSRTIMKEALKRAVKLIKTVSLGKKHRYST